MPAFNFELDPLLKSHRRDEQHKQLAMAELQHEKMTIEAKLRRQQAHLAAGKTALRGGLVGTVDPTSLRQQAAVSMQVDKEARQAALTLAGVQQRIERAREDLIEATRRRRSVELLRERRYAEWKRKVEKAESERLDEVASRLRNSNPTTVMKQ